MNKQSMTIQQNFPMTEKPEGSFLVHDAAIKYLGKYSQYTFGALGLNCLININISNDPKDWMLEKFASHIPNIDLLGIETNLICPSGSPGILSRHRIKARYTGNS